VPEPLVAGRLRLVWLPRGDRIGHRIEILTSDGPVAVLESIEEPIDPRTFAANDGPPSPPLTEWHCEDRSPSLRVALGVGRSGKCHWSAAVECAAFVPDGSRVAGFHGASRLSFDIACRVTGEPGFLGSQYHSPGGCRTVDSGRIELLGNVLLSCDDATTRMQLDAATGTIVIRPVRTATHSRPQTIQWRYSIECTDC